MPKLPRVSGAQAVRALERLGFAVARQRGSYTVLRKLRQASQNVTGRFALYRARCSG
jgi:predicted RNA binding protein YcfA (HicA-like mRNA interferase family)